MKYLTKFIVTDLVSVSEPHEYEFRPIKGDFVIYDNVKFVVSSITFMQSGSVQIVCRQYECLLLEIKFLRTVGVVGVGKESLNQWTSDQDI